MPRRRGRRGGGGWGGWSGEWFPPSRPRPTDEGIKARSRRGAFAESWWGRRWIEVLEGFGLGARLSRGKRYARSGQVLSVELEAGRVRATVQGSRARPYRVEIGLTRIPDATWDEVLGALAGDAAFGARLLNGELVPEAEPAFAEGGAPLLPRTMRELDTDCSCPDWSNPCKHIAAVHYLIAEELDRDPFLLFALRGLERDALVERLQRGRADGDDVGSGGGPAGEEEDATLSADPDVFWSGPAATDPATAVEGKATEATASEATAPEALRPPDPTAPLLRRLGPIPFWRGRRALLEELEPVCRRASHVAMGLLTGEE